MDLKRVLIAGEGGQGIQALAHILTSAAFESKKQVSFLPNFGVEQRGGVSLAYIEISDFDISFPKFSKADIVVLFAPRAVKRIEQYLTKNTVVLFDNSLVPEQDLSHLRVLKVAIPASRLAKQKLIPRVANMILLGAVTGELEGLKIARVEKEVEKLFSEKIKKEPQLKHFNLKALKMGHDIMVELKKESKWREKIIKK